MTNDLDAFINNLQEEIFDEAKAAFGEAGFQRWRDPKFNGRMEDCDTSAALKGECGDTIGIYLKFDNNRVKAASYTTDGCASSAICGSFTAELAIGKDPEELTEINENKVIEKIGRLPEEDRHCAFLASASLQEALRLYMMKKIQKDKQ